MSGHSTYQPQSPFMQWMERRLPIASLVYSSFIAYPTPRNLNYWWTFGGILTFMLGVQIVTGIVLAMHYTPHVDLAFNLRRIDHARRQLRLAVALPARQRRVVLLRRRLRPHRARHVLRLLQGAARGAVDPRRHPVPADGGDRLHGLRAALGPDELLGRHRHHQPVLGACPASASRSSPGCGAALRSAIRRSTASIRCTTCCRSSSPAWWCCTSGRCTWSGRTIRPASSRRPRRTPWRSRPMRPSRTRFFIGVFCLFFAWFVFYIPNYLGHSDNYIPANPGQTPTHIVPEWYYLPFYAILRAIPSKLLGVTALARSIVILAFLPWLDTSRVRSANYRPLYRQFLLDLLRRRDRARLSRLAGAVGRLCDRGAHPHRLLFRLLPRHPAAARIVRDDQAAAEFDFGIGAAAARCRSGVKA